MSTSNSDLLEDALGEDTPLYVEPNGDLQAWLTGIGNELDRYDSEQTDVLQRHHVDTAEGIELERIGDLVNVTRRTGESDEQLRQRIKIRGRVTVTSGTTDEMMELSALALETDFSNLSFPVDLATTPAEFPVEASTSVISDAVLSQQTIEDELSRGVPVGHRVTLTAT